VSTTELDELLARMPSIAKAVNAFSSEAVQLAAFRALVGVHDGGGDSQEDHGEANEDLHGEEAIRKRRRPRRTAAPKAATGGKPAQRKPAGNPSIDKNLNLRPGGKQSLKDFLADKSPKTNNERSTVAVYYLSHVLQLDAVTTDQVFTCYRDVGWKLPGDFRNHLQVVASRNGWLDTRNMEDIKILASGINLVEHDLLRRAAKS
jgi:hypothetical protein